MTFSTREELTEDIGDNQGSLTMLSTDYLVRSYLTHVEKGKLVKDPFQHQVVLELQTVFNQVLRQNIDHDNESSNSHFDKLFSRFVSKQQIPISKGLYIWGKVGRGKTHWVNYFYKHLPIQKKLRLHFHRFMQLVHEELEKLDQVPDPLFSVAVST